MVPFHNCFLAVVGVFSSPVKKVLTHTVMDIVIAKADEAIILVALLMSQRSSDIA